MPETAIVLFLFMERIITHPTRRSRQRV